MAALIYEIGSSTYKVDHPNGSWTNIEITALKLVDDSGLVEFQLKFTPFSSSTPEPQVGFEPTLVIKSMDNFMIYGTYQEYVGYLTNPDGTRVFNEITGTYIPDLKVETTFYYNLVTGDLESARFKFTDENNNVIYDETLNNGSGNYITNDGGSLTTSAYDDFLDHFPRYFGEAGVVNDGLLYSMGQHFDSAAELGGFNVNQQVLNRRNSYQQEQ